MEKTEGNPEVFVKRLHHGRSQAFVAGHPSCNGKACKEMKRMVCLETSNSAWKTGLTDGKGMFFHRLPHLYVTTLTENRSAAGFIASFSTE